MRRSLDVQTLIKWSRGGEDAARELLVLSTFFSVTPSGQRTYRYLSA